MLEVFLVAVLYAEIVDNECGCDGAGVVRDQVAFVKCAPILIYVMDECCLGDNAGLGETGISSYAGFLPSFGWAYRYANAKVLFTVNSNVSQYNAEISYNSHNK